MYKSGIIGEIRICIRQENTNIYIYTYMILELYGKSELVFAESIHIYIYIHRHAYMILELYEKSEFVFAESIHGKIGEIRICIRREYTYIYIYTYEYIYEVEL